MKINKKFKTISLAFGLGIIGVVPIITTACSKPSSQRQSGTNTNQIIVPKTNESANPQVSKDVFGVTTKSSELVVASQGLFSSKLTDFLNTNFEKLKSESKTEEFDKLISNLNGFKAEQKQNLKYEFSLAQQEDKKVFGNREYKDWRKEVIPSTSILYLHLDKKVKVSSIKELKDEINKTLTSALSSKKNTLAYSYVNYEIVENDNYYIDDQATFFAFHVKAISISGKKFDYEARLPLSSIILAPKLNLKVSGNNVVETTTNVNLEFNIGSKTTTSYSFDNNAYKHRDGSNIALLSNLGWSFVPYGYEEAHKNDPYVLYPEKIAQDLGIFDVEFKSLTFKYANESNKGKADHKFKIEIKAIPKVGFVWEDGTSEEKTINVENINFKNAIVLNEESK